ncbi:MAG: hypothetical protein JO257_09820 [Deltaproteobacteria bacterium]|nr:hypothetical protein [Deltaproteobacteria bacterium]
MKHSFAIVLLAVGCRSGSHPGEGSATRPACSPQLTELAKFYEAVAAENAVPSISARIETSRVRHVPELGSGAAVDTSHATLLLVDPSGSTLVTGDSGAVVLVIDAATPWSHVEDVLRTVAPSASVSVAYRVKGAFADRKPPKALDTAQLDLPTIADSLAKTTATHCPAYAAQLAGLKTGTVAITDPAFLRGLAASLPSCDCDVDLALLEVMPWLTATMQVTTVPLAATAPAHDPGQTWGDLVAAAKGPVPLALPAAPPPPPPPPLPHHR